MKNPTSADISDDIVRTTFGLPRPKSKLTRYFYGFEDRDLKLGECLDEQAWMVELEYAGSREKPESLQLATIRLLPGVSQTQAIEAVKLALKYFPKPAQGQRKGKRPGLRPKERKILDETFQKFKPYLHQRGMRNKTVQVAEAKLKQKGSPRHYSTIMKELTHFMTKNSIPIKPYVTSSRPSTP